MNLLFSVTAKDFDIQTFTAGGNGGQNQNRVRSGVRLVHRASGARGEARDSRDQGRNRQAAFNRLLCTPEWKAWHKTEVSRRLGHEVAARATVDNEMSARNLRVEVRTAQGWVPEPGGMTDLLEGG